MKKLYTLAFMALTAVAMNGQNLVANGGLEIWTDATTAEGFPAVTSGTFSANNFVAQESTIKHSGNFSASQLSQNSPTQVFGNVEIPVIPGHSYTISYWVLDNEPTTKSRIWSAWVTGTGAASTDMADNADVLHPTAYTTDSASWVEVTQTLIAPATANRFKFQIRTYRASTDVFGGKIYYDDLSFTDNTLGVKENAAIAGLKVYPNPVKGGNLYITSDNSASKQVVLYDVLGKQVINTTVSNAPLNVSNLNSGVYIVKITEEGKTATRKLVIQ